MTRDNHTPAQPQPLTGPTVTLIDENTFSALVSHLHARPYRLQQQGDGLPQNTIVKITVPALEHDWPGIPLAEWAATPIGDYTYPWQAETHWEREYYPCLEDVVNDLHARGLLAAGNYALHVRW
ncbi:hypothetical protein [Nocardia asiatica]|uniref:hypothetical protein n=1 Tax=Nocardia asiatica TaxID=209252 RepID=UPI00030A6AAC|nr:hypothetical protein [Nocardia asiatica]